MRAKEFIIESKIGKQASTYQRSNRYPDGSDIPESLPERYQPASNPGVPKGQNCANCLYYSTDSKKCSIFKGDPVVKPLYWCVKWKEYKEEIDEAITEKWSNKYKRSINCSNPKGFSQKAHCAGRNKNEEVEENFADGKKPGRKGLAKRSGVNTKASVSSLRKTAKNSTGEKARMAHWLANMKAGKAKKK